MIPKGLFHRLAALFTCLFVNLYTVPALAWGDQGHEIIARIAYARLTPGTRARVDALLAGDTDTLTAGDFASRAAWADKWRDSDRDGARRRYEATRQWHFADIELKGGNLDEACFLFPSLPHSPPGAPQRLVPASEGPARDCVVSKIEQFEAELKARATPMAEQLLALKYLVHLLGDLHQPLHVADNHDRGGNAVPVLFAGNDTVTDAFNLHYYWDIELPRRLGADPAEVARQLNAGVLPAQAREWIRGGPRQWTLDTHQLALSVAYNFQGVAERSDARGKKALFLDSTYDSRALPAVREQLAKAGVRLAWILNRSSPQW